MASEQMWSISYCAGYIVPPCKGLEPEDVIEQINGAPVSLESEVINYFRPLFVDSWNTCTIEIAFLPIEDNEGEFEQYNPIRDMVRKIADGSLDEKTTCSKQLALQLALASDRRSPTGLFVVVAGNLADESRVTLFKFPADESRQAVFSRDGLSIQVVENAFSRKTNYFKAAVFQGNASNNAFWIGRVEDKQATQRIYEVSDLWAIRFLQSAPQLTSSRGTRLLARALRDLINDLDDPDTQQSLLAAATTIRSQEDRNISLGEFAEQYLPAEVRQPFLDALGEPTLANAVFQVDRTTLDEQLGVRTIVLDNRFSVTGPIDDFENREFFEMTSPDENGLVQITLRGYIVGQRIRTTKSLPR